MSGQVKASTGADLLVECLVRLGVSTLFGVPGDTGVSFYDALYKRTGDIRHVLARDERNAAYMADAYARLTRTAGVVEVSSGGGSTYVVGGLGEAYAASVPVLLIASDIPVASRGSGALTELDQRALFSAVTKWHGLVESAASLPRLLTEALRQATLGRPAPVVLVIPEDVLDEHVGLDLDDRHTTTRKFTTPLERPTAEAGSVSRAATLLASASRPAVVAGSGVHWSGAYSSLAALVEHSGIPVATTIHGH
jgi:acetolactate synthase-1/2/3 large subunit